jgi:hypothetical protein
MAEAASLWPYEMPSKLVPSPVPEASEESTLRELSSTLGGDALVLCRIRVQGLRPEVVVDLAVFDPVRGEIEKATTLLPGLRYRLVETADWVWSVAATLVLLLFIWGMVVWFRGYIVVRIHHQSDSHHELFTIELSRTGRTPELGDPEAYRLRMQDLAPAYNPRKAWGVGKVTKFRRIPRGRWYVSLYGVYQHGRRLVAVNDAPTPVEVHARKMAEVVFDLQNRMTEFQITVHDGGHPVAGARIWVDGNVKGAVVTDAAGGAVVQVAHGYRVLHVVAKDVETKRPYHVIKTQRHEMQINLELERRRDNVSRALEDQQPGDPDLSN